jgi:hypothetical protein
MTRLAELWRSRIDGCPDAPILEYRRSVFITNGKIYEHAFDLISGNLDLPPDKDRAFYDYLLVEDDDGIAGPHEGPNELPVEALFDDLSVSGHIFPLTRYTKHKWQDQHPIVQAKLRVADIRDLVVQGNNTKVTLQTWSAMGLKFASGRRYRISRRLVDFNIGKVLATLVELDLRWDADEGQSSKNIPFLQLISDPQSFTSSEAASQRLLKKEQGIQSKYRELQRLGSKSAEALMLKSSQRRAAKRMLSRRLSVVWGPPGMDTLGCQGSLMLTLFECRYRQDVHNRSVAVAPSRGRISP